MNTQASSVTESLIQSVGVPELICQCHVGPVTALAVCSQKIVWGCGSEICVLDLNTNKLEIRRQILIGASVHGIKTGPSDAKHQLLCVYGGKQARAVSIDIDKPNEDITLLSDVMEFIDWIWDVHWLVNEPDCIALALAHNFVVKWNMQSGIISSQRDCMEKCILYCAHFIGSTWESLVLAAGTVFNQIVLWPIACNSQTAGEPVDVMHTFSGHQGVIFSIRYHENLQRLCSVSDDRSIRMWQLSFLNGTLKEPSPEDWRCVKSDLLLMLYGHSARVWDVVLTTNYFASVGEDAICCIWNYAGNILHKFKGHKGRNIWGLATSEDEKFVLTGGGDGSIRMWEIHQEKTNKTVQRIVTVPQSHIPNPDYFPRIVTMLNFDLILIMMNSGELFSYSVSDCKFSLIVSDTIFRSYSIVSPCPDQRTLALGSITGVVRVIQLPDMQDEEIKCSEISLFNGKVLALTWLDRHHFLASGPGGLCLLHKVEAVPDVDTDDVTLCIQMQYQLTLPHSKHRWITAACIVPAREQDSSTSLSVLICGDKDGSIHCYSLSEDDVCSSFSELKPSKSFTKVHGKAGVTFVCYRDGIVYTAGRDGFYWQWEMKAGNLSQLHGNKIIKGFEWIDRLEWHNNDLLVYGFFSSMFVVWSVPFNQQLISVHCGGGHRSWGCCYDNDILRFAYLKAGKVYMVDSGHQDKQIILLPELHGRTICDVKFMTIFADETDNPIHVVCSAGEDTTIKIGAFVNDNSLSTWMPITTLKGHMSSVRSLALSSQSIKTVCWYKSKAYLKDSAKCLSSEPERGDNFILFSGGGRAEVRAWKLTLVKKSVFPESLNDNVNNLNHKKINFISDKDKNSHFNNLQDDFNFDASMEDLSIPDQNSVNPDHIVLSSLPDSLTQGSSYQIQCNYQHLSTHFLGEPHKRKSRRLRLDPETRIMCIDVSSLTDLSNEYQDKMSTIDKVLMTEYIEHLSKFHILSCAGSDGVFRIFAFDEHTRIFTSLVDSTYHQSCILKVLHYVHYSDLKHYSYTVSAATNGCIVFWSLNSFVTKLITDALAQKSKSFTESEKGGSSTGSGSCDDTEDGDEEEEDASGVNYRDWEPLLSLKVHQSGVNSLHILQVSESQLLLASGGDDNAMTVQLLEVSDSGMKVVAKVTKEDAHAAQVTGIHLISSTLVVSASIDQRVCVWSIKQTSGIDMQLQLMACKYISVADISSMSVYIHRNSVYLSIGGEGLCLYKLGTEDVISQ